MRSIEKNTIVLRWLPRLGGILLLSLAVAITASAQYGGGGGSGSSPNTGYSHGNGKAIGIGVGAGAAAAVGAILYIHHRHTKANAARSQTSLIGCTQSEINGISLMDENDQQTYMIISSGDPLEAGQRVELRGVVTDEGPGTHTFQVKGPIRSYGTCNGAAAALVPKDATHAN